MTAGLLNNVFFACSFHANISIGLWSHTYTYYEGSNIHHIVISMGLLILHWCATIMISITVKNSVLVEWHLILCNSFTS